MEARVVLGMAHRAYLQKAVEPFGRMGGRQHDWAGRFALGSLPLRLRHPQHASLQEQQQRGRFAFNAGCRQRRAVRRGQGWVVWSARSLVSGPDLASTRSL